MLEQQKERKMSNQRRSTTAMADSLGLLLRDLDRYPMPNYDEQVELAKRVAKGDDEAGCGRR